MNRRAVCRRLQAAADVRIEHPLTAPFVVQGRVEGRDRVMTGPARAEPVGVGLEAALPFRFERHLDDGLHDAVLHGGNPQGPLSAVRLGNVHAANRPRAVSLETQAVLQERQTGLGRVAHHSVDAWRVLAVILLGHLPDRQELGSTRAHEKLLQVLHPRPLPACGGAKDAALEAAHVALHRGPVNVGPRRQVPATRLFDAWHRLTSGVVSGAPVLLDR